MSIQAKWYAAGGVARGSGVSVGANLNRKENSTSSPRWRRALHATLLLLGCSTLVILAILSFTGTGLSITAAAGLPRAAQSTFVLYDGALNTGTPDTQGFIYLTFPLTNALATQSFTNGVTLLDTTPRMTDYAGYFARRIVDPTFYPPLDRSHGYQVLFTTQVISESHVSENRAGFSILVIGNDKLGIELGFWTNEIWAQSASFVHAEQATFTTTAGLIDYRLAVLGDAYSLAANGVTVLTGQLRDYTQAVTPFPVNPYTTPNLIFLGDDTSAAQGTIRISAASVIDGPPFSLYLPIVTKN